jgi:uncharacterized protein (TIGR03083 family)
MDYDRCCVEIVTQSQLLRATIGGADLATPVPSCPGWSLRQLVRHLGGAHRWVETIVRTRAAEPPPDREVRNVAGVADEDPAALGAWLAEGAELLTGTLRAAGPDAQVWTPVPRGVPTPVFYARRMTHETLVHRADATLALGRTFTVEPEVAVDALDEWMALGSIPEMLEVHPRQRELLGPGRILRFHATDIPPEAAADWLVDLTGGAITCGRDGQVATEDVAVAVHGPLTELIMVIYRRRPVGKADVEVLGDRGLLDFWLERVAFG